MPDHERKQIRDAVVAQLMGATSAGDRVQSTRMMPVRRMQLPFISVYADSESVEKSNEAPREHRRVVTLAIEGWVAASEGNVDDALDELALEIEEALDQNSLLDGSASDMVLSGSEFGIKLDGDRAMGAVRIEYDVTYFTLLRLVEDGDPFERAEIKYSLSNEQAPLDQAHDSLTDIHADEDPPVPEEEP